MAEDPEYAAQVKAKKKEEYKRHTARRSAKLAALKEAAANGDKNAIEELAAIRTRGSEATLRSRKRRRITVSCWQMS